MAKIDQQTQHTPNTMYIFSGCTVYIAIFQLYSPSVRISSQQRQYLWGTWDSHRCDVDNGIEFRPKHVIWGCKQVSMWQCKSEQHHMQWRYIKSGVSNQGQLDHVLNNIRTRKEKHICLSVLALCWGSPSVVNGGLSSQACSCHDFILF